MKTVSVRDLQKKVKECMDEAQGDRVIVTRHGKPAAILLGVEGEDWESVILQTDPAFWNLIQERRKQPTVSFKKVKTLLKRKSA